MRDHSSTGGPSIQGTDPTVNGILAEFACAPSSNDAPTVAELRAAPGLMMKMSPNGPVLHSVTDRVIAGSGGGLVLREFRPGPNPTGSMLWLHGGGWVTGTLNAYDGFCRTLAARTNFTTVAVDYRLAPENPFPAALDDSLAALRWLHTKEPAGPLVVAGDSAGGNLAGGLAWATTFENGPRIDGQILFYPVTNDDFTTQSYLDYGQGTNLTRERMIWFWNQYAPRAADRTDPRVVLLQARDPSRIPRTLLFTAEFDPLRDEGEAYARRLADAGVPVTWRRCPSMIHGFLALHGHSAIAASVIDDVVMWLQP